MSVIGQGQACYVINETVADTDPRVSKVSILDHSRIVSYVLVANGTLDGAWLIEGCNDYSAAGGSAWGQPPTVGTWINITALFKRADGTAIAAVAHGTAATQTQGAQAAPVGYRAVRATFTASTGTGTVQAIVGGGAY